ncbi:MAG: M3 family oligoendopeptidase [Clostridiales bacterium]|nr:M3 family oligoendopeptidase [Clostridiales bacterium]
MNSEWSLDALYKGYDSEEFKRDMALTEVEVRKFNEAVSQMSKLPPKEALLSVIGVMEENDALFSDLFNYCGLMQSVNTRDENAAAYLGQLQAKYSEMTKATTAFEKYVSSIDDLEAVIASDEKLTDYGYMLRNIKENSEHLLSEEAEEIIALFNISGGGAWSDLQSSLTSSVTADYRGEKLTLSAIRNKAYDPDPEVRREAYFAELACYDKIKEPVAAALNSIKLQVINESRLRGFESPLAQTLHYEHMKKETLDALLTAMREYMPQFREYLKIKAKALGHKNGLPWYDLFAPMGANDRTYTAEEARDYLLRVFGGFDDELRAMAERAFSESWIDFYPREGKVGGAFCSGLRNQRQSRVLTNFDGSFSDIVTIAHELGHAFHNLNIEELRPLNDDYSMPVAETASTFNEHVVMDAAIAAASDPAEKLALLESQLMDVTQIIVDIYSRFLIETAVFENREESFMFPDKLCEMMICAQKEAYGDGLDPEYLHPYMWICKSHYYSSGLSFYNWPYAFGGMFARGLYAKYMKEGQAFVKKYKELLKATPINGVEATAAIAGIDVTSPDFWRMSLASYREKIDEFGRLVSELY